MLHIQYTATLVHYSFIQSKEHRLGVVAFNPSTQDKAEGS